MKNKFNLQMFAAPEDMIGKAQITTTAREIDFVTSFTESLTAMTDVLGIAKLIKKQSGTVLNSKKVTGTLKSGTVAEGEEIPLTRYSIANVPYDTITIEKHRKAVSVEAIAEYGYDVAVNMTDEEFKVQLRNNVVDKFYAYLKTGTLTLSEATFQKAISMAIGKVKHKFQTIDKTATGVAVFVNTLDVYKYLGDKDVTVQTAFGMDYIENFLGADVLFMSSDIDENQVIATPINNIIGYYVDPADSDFAKAGLEYTSDAETGMIGFHVDANYSRALSEAFALIGIRIFAEYVDAIAVATVTGA